MFVKVELNDGTIINPVFEPSATNLEQIPVFYKNQADWNLIRSFVITLDSGKTLALGGRF
jgi:hypothetical protein